MWGAGLLNGLRISMRNMLRGPITIQYPYERFELPERARWALAPKYDESGNPKCTACMICVKTCPDHILDIDVTAREDGTKHIDRYYYEVGACMMCGLCVEACPFDAILMSHDYELAVTDPSRLARNLLEDVDAASGRRARAATASEEPTAPATAAGPAAPPASAEGGGADE